MLILQIAVGIVLAVLALAFLPVILEMLLKLTLVAVVVVAILITGLVAYFIWNNPTADVVASVFLVVSILIAIILYFRSQRKVQEEETKRFVEESRLKDVEYKARRAAAAEKRMQRIKDSGAT